MSSCEAGFGAVVTESADLEPLLRLLYREVIRYDLKGQELPERDVFTGLDEGLGTIYSGFTLIPYTDYFASTREGPGIITSLEELYDATLGCEAHFGSGLRLHNISGSAYFLGWGGVGGEWYQDRLFLKEEQLLQLMVLTRRLQGEGRWSDGRFGLIQQEFRE